MNKLFSLSLLLFLGLTFFSCKEKTAETTTQEVDATVQGTGAKFVADAKSGRVMWEGSKPTGTHTGYIDVSAAELYVVDGKLNAGNFTMDMNSITVTDLDGEDKANLEAHLKGTQAEGAEDFFNVTKFPTAKFEITSVSNEAEAGANTTVKGNLTMMDITKEVTIPALINITDNNVSIVTNPFKINRTDWGIKYKSKNFFEKLGDKFVNDDVVLQIKMEALPAK